MENQIKEIGKRVAKAMEYAGLTDAELSRRAGLTKAGVGKIKKGEGKNIYITTLTAIATACKVNRNWLIDGGDDNDMGLKTYNVQARGGFNLSQDAEIRDIANEGYALEANQIRSVPVLTRQQLVDKIVVKDLTKDNHSQWATTDSEMSKTAFAYIMDSNAMLQPGHAKSIPLGATVFIETDVSAASGDLVIVTDGESVILKQLEVDGPNRYLASLNPNYQPIVMTSNHQILGVAVDVKYSLR